MIIKLGKELAKYLNVKAKYGSGDMKEKFLCQSFQEATGKRQNIQNYV